MEQKGKFIIIGLIGLAVIFLFLFVGTLNQKQQLMKEKAALQDDNAKLGQKIDSLQKDLSDTKNKASLLAKQVDELSSAKDEVERRLDLANKEKNDLLDKIKSLQSKQSSPMQQVTSQTDAYWATVLKQKTDLELQLSSLSSDFKQAQIANEQLQREKTTLELGISNLRREKEDLKREYDYNKKMLDSISQELVRERSDKLQMQDSFKLIKSENTILSRQLESLNNRKMNLEKQLQEVMDKKDNIEQKYDDMQTMLSGKISQVNDLKEELDAIRQGATPAPEAISESRGAVELPPIVVRPQASEQPSREISMASVGQGKVLAVNKDSNFVIVDLGEDAGVKVGDVFQVYRDDNSVASVEAIQVRKNISACDIKKQSTVIKVGDTIR